MNCQALFSLKNSNACINKKRLLHAMILHGILKVNLNEFMRCPGVSSPDRIMRSRI